MALPKKWSTISFVHFWTLEVNLLSLVNDG
jgi:hypothetical protein